MMNRHTLLRALPEIERYALTILAVVSTLAIRLVLDPMLTNRAPYLFFVITIVIVKRLWGRGPGLLATLLGGIAAWYFILEPQFSFAISNRADVLNLACYFAVGAGISFLGEMSWRSPSTLSVGTKNIKVSVVRQTAVLAGAVVVLAGMVLLLLHDFRRTQDAQGWVAHTYQVIDSAQSLRSAMDDAAVGERRYLQTGDARELTYCNAAISAIPRKMEELENLTADNPEQQARLIQVKQHADIRLSMFKRALDLYKTSGTDTALAALSPREGLDLWGEVDAVANAERGLLQVRTAVANVQALRGRWVLGLGSGR